MSIRIDRKKCQYDLLKNSPLFRASGCAWWSKMNKLMSSETRNQSFTIVTFLFRRMRFFSMLLLSLDTPVCPSFIFAFSKIAYIRMPIYFQDANQCVLFPLNQYVQSLMHRSIHTNHAEIPGYQFRTLVIVSLSTPQIPS